MRRGLDPESRNYLLNCLKTTPKQRMDWLTGAHEFVRKTMSLKKRRLWLHRRSEGLV